MKIELTKHQLMKYVKFDFVTKSASGLHYGLHSVTFSDKFVELIDRIGLQLQNPSVLTDADTFTNVIGKDKYERKYFLELDVTEEEALVLKLVM